MFSTIQSIEDAHAVLKKNSYILLGLFGLVLVLLTILLIGNQDMTFNWIIFLLLAGATFIAFKYKCRTAAAALFILMALNILNEIYLVYLNEKTWTTLFVDALYLIFSLEILRATIAIHKFAREMK
ncbi:MAG: hypothetical protein KC680_04655 [Candidatus Peregrinibacteria bacterium]|nr:hypothetical protein [Candidatus Peregrinibacteria bacterium]MCB9808223.1 hypothetical protein [Candidatus Peribacteria bacterium]